MNSSSTAVRSRPSKPAPNEGNPPPRSKSLGARVNRDLDCHHGIQFNFVDDLIGEPDETFTVTLDSVTGTNASLGSGPLTTTVTIHDNSGWNPSAVGGPTRKFKFTFAGAITRTECCGCCMDAMRATVQTPCGGGHGWGTELFFPTNCET